MVLDWRKHQMTRAGVQVAIGVVVEGLPEMYEQELFDEKVERVYEHVYDAYLGEEKSVYTRVR